MNDKAKECIKRVSDKKVGIEDDRVSWGTSIYARIHIDYIECAHYFVNIDMCE